MLFCTVCTASHFARAQTLARSIADIHPESHSVLCLCESHVDPRISEASLFDEIVLAHDLGYARFAQFLFRYTAIEACCALKPRILLTLQDRFPDEQCFVYMDADTRLYSRLEGLDETLANTPIVVTPQHTAPMTGIFNIHLFLTTAILTGAYNAGFVAVNRSDEGGAFLRWWDSVLQAACVKDPNQGFFYDQGWLNLVPGMFATYVERDPGWNTAPWNVAFRTLTLGDAGQYLALDRPLRFFHFSQLDKVNVIRPFLGNGEQTLTELIADYQASVGSAGDADFRTIPWSYSRFSSGEPVADWSRTVYWKSPRFLAENGDTDPFRLSNAAFLPCDTFGGYE